MGILVVWEPILATDWKSPSGSTMARISDPRVRQFWDPEHSVSGALNEFAKQKASEPPPNCCIQKGIHWDQAILFAPSVRWKDQPAVVFRNGPVVKAIPGLEKALAELRGTVTKRLGAAAIPASRCELCRDDRAAPRSDYLGAKAPEPGGARRGELELRPPKQAL